MDNKTDIFLTGEISNDANQKVVFILENYKLILKNTDSLTSEIELVPDSNGYIFGIVHGSSKYKAIAIFINKTTKVKSAKSFTVLNFILLKTIPSFDENRKVIFPEFQGIKFVNGSVLSVNPCSSLREDAEKADEIKKLEKDNPHHYFVYKFIPHKREFTYESENEQVVWQFSSTIHQNVSDEGWCSLDNNESTLTIQFSSSQGLGSFYNYYGYVTTFLSYMTFRVATPFEKVSLLYMEPKYGLKEYAECYVNGNWSFWGTDQVIQQRNGVSQSRKPINSLNVSELSDESFNLILQSIIRPNNKIVGLPISIIPQDDLDAKRITPEKIKTICSMIEIEADAGKIGVTIGTELNTLINEVKDVIKSYQSNPNTKIDKKTYDNIFNSIGHWGKTLADRTIEAWHANTDILAPWIRQYGIDVSDESIANTVKARNNLTHRGFQSLDESIYLTGFALLGLAYILSLKRMKVSDISILSYLLRGL